MKKSFLAFATSLCLINFSAFAESNENRPDAHAPVGVMGDHVHKKGEYMLSYRYDFMRMKGNLNESNRVSPADIHQDYMMAPLKMDMKMHMVGAMYGITDDFSLMAMGSFISTKMKMAHEMDMGMGMVMRENMNEKVSGFGDTSLSGMYQFYKDSANHAQFNLGVSIPTGSIKETEGGSRVAYAMQLGSGSYELLPALSYSGLQDSYSYGSQINGRFLLNDNNSGYRLGDSYSTTVWAAKKLNEAFSLSSRLNYVITQKTKNAFSGLNDMDSLMMSPMNNASYSGGRRLDFLLGANFIVPSGTFKGHRLAVEGGTPLYQKVNGIQMRNSYNFTFGWQKAF